MELGGKSSKRGGKWNWAGNLQKGAGNGIGWEILKKGREMELGGKTSKSGGKWNWAGKPQKGAGNGFLKIQFNFSGISGNLFFFRLGIVSRVVYADCRNGGAFFQFVVAGNVCVL